MEANAALLGDDGAASGNDSDDDSVASESEIGGAFARSAAGRG